MTSPRWFCASPTELLFGHGWRFSSSSKSANVATEHETTARSSKATSPTTTHSSSWSSSSASTSYDVDAFVGLTGKSTDPPCVQLLSPSNNEEDHAACLEVWKDLDPSCSNSLISDLSGPTVPHVIEVRQPRNTRSTGPVEDCGETVSALDDDFLSGRIMPVTPTAGPLSGGGGLRSSSPDISMPPAARLRGARQPPPPPPPPPPKGGIGPPPPSTVVAHHFSHKQPFPLTRRSTPDRNLAALLEMSESDSHSSSLSLSQQQRFPQYLFSDHRRRYHHNNNSTTMPPPSLSSPMRQRSLVDQATISSRGTTSNPYDACEEDDDEDEETTIYFWGALQQGDVVPKSSVGAKSMASTAHDGSSYSTGFHQSPRSQNIFKQLREMPTARQDEEQLILRLQSSSSASSSKHNFHNSPTPLRHGGRSSGGGACSPSDQELLEATRRVKEAILEETRQQQQQQQQQLRYRSPSPVLHRSHWSLDQSSLRPRSMSAARMERALWRTNPSPKRSHHHHQCGAAPTPPRHVDLTMVRNHPPRRLMLDTTPLDTSCEASV